MHFVLVVFLMLLTHGPASAEESTPPRFLQAPQPSSPHTNLPDAGPAPFFTGPVPASPPFLPLPSVAERPDQNAASGKQAGQALGQAPTKSEPRKRRGKPVKPEASTLAAPNSPPALLRAETGTTASKQANTSWFSSVLNTPAAQSEASSPSQAPFLPGLAPKQPDLPAALPAEEVETPVKIESVLTKKLRQKEKTPPLQPTEKPSETIDMLTSVLDLQKNLRQQMNITGKRLKTSGSETEKAVLQEELTQLDKQLSDTAADFERIATGVEPAVLVEPQPESYSWRDELTSLLEPAIKELKQLTARARQKAQLKDTISEYHTQVAAARRAVDNLKSLIADTKDAKIKTSLQELLPAWQNAEKRVASKLDLAQMELAKLQDKETSLVKSSSNSIREFFHDRGIYLLLAFLAFVVILLACRLLYRLLFHFLPGARQEKRPFHIRILDIFFQLFSVTSAICGLIFVLYTAEDWFLLSITIIFFLGLAWTVRLALPRLWQQARLMLNLGSVREGERVIYNGLPWKVESINVFSKLVNPSLGQHLRIPIENMVGLVSRPFSPDEPWFPCKKDDWIVMEGKPQAKVVQLSHEQVEVVELGGRRIVYPTAVFIAASPANLSRNFSLRAVFGLSYDLQATITTTVPAILKAFIAKRLDENGYSGDCLNLSVEFLQAGPSSLDLVVLADFKGEAAALFKRIERALHRWCVECCNANNWEIPFPQMTVHRAAGER